MTIAMTFKKNIEILQTIDPELAKAIIRADRSEDIKVFTSKKGGYSLKIGNIALHSLYDPVKEAKDWAGYCEQSFKTAPGIVVFGLGLGYHIVELSKRTGVDLVVFEPRLGILKTAFELVDLSSILSRIRIITGDKIPDLCKGFIILEHKPSLNLNPEYFERLSSRLRVLQKIKRGLRIMVVSPIYGGSFPVAQFCDTALRNLGHHVDFVDNRIYKDPFLAIDCMTSDKTHQNQLREMFINYVSEAIIARCNEFKPDLILALAQAPLSVGALQKLKDNKVPTIFWFVEDFRLMEYWQDIAPLYDYFFTIQKGEFFDRLKDKGIRNFSYLPLAASLDVHKKVELTEDESGAYGSDISFVGAGYRNRRRFFAGLLDFQFRIWGNEWDLTSPVERCIQRSGERVETEEIVKIFNAARININLHSSTYHDGVNPYGDFVNPRAFEIAACGGFQLVDYRSELPELFEAGKEIVCFKDIDDLKRKIRYYLNNPDEREEIALSGKERVLREHTYEHRMKRMLDLIFEKGYEPPVWKTEMQDVETLRDTAHGNQELEEYLERFADEGSIGLEDIIRDIQTQDGSLSKVEKMFLLMNTLKAAYTRRG